MRDVNTLIKLVKLDAQVKKLEAEIEDLENFLDVLDDKVQTYETSAPEIAEVAAKAYNEFDLKRIELELRKNHLEKEILHIEYEAAIAE